MIAKNFIRYPEALRFQREMFSNGYKNSPRIMRLMTVIFKQLPDVPAWVKEAAAAAKRLVAHWKKGQMELNFAAGYTAKGGPGTPASRYPGAPVMYRGPDGQTWSGRGQVPKWLRQMVSWGNSMEAFRLQ